MIPYHKIFLQIWYCQKLLENYLVDTSVHGPPNGVVVPKPIVVVAEQRWQVLEILSSILNDRNYVTVDSFHWRTLANWYCCRSRCQRNSQQPCLRIRPKLFWNTRFLKVKYSCIAYHLAHPTFVRTWICNRLSPSRILKYETHFIIFFCNHWHR